MIKILYVPHGCDDGEFGGNQSLLRPDLSRADRTRIVHEGSEGAEMTVWAIILSSREKAERLIERAKSGGGFDNITVILCEVV